MPAQNPKEPKPPESDTITPRRQSSPAKRGALKKVLRARTRLLVCIATFPVYAVAVWVLLNNGNSIDGFMFMYMVLWTAFALDMSLRKCPACGEQFYVKSVFLRLTSKHCAHCGLDLAATENPDSSKMEF